MNLYDLSQIIENKYVQYLKTTFYFSDPILRKSFANALGWGSLSKGPYLEATPIFRQCSTPSVLFENLLTYRPENALLQAVHGERPLYQHQEVAIEKVHKGRNVIIATGTGSGKTEAFLFPILLSLYQEFKAHRLCPGVRALVLYPMNALANDQRERLGEICKCLETGDSQFRFSFGQYTGETPENEKDSYRNAPDRLANRLPGELVLRSEMREDPPHILLTNYSMLEYLLLRPSDSPLFDNGRAQWWKFFVLDEAHQYRGSRGIEMAMLLRRLKVRLKEGGRREPFRCIATSATLTNGEEDKAAVAEFASNLFGEDFLPEDVVLGQGVSIPPEGVTKLTSEDYGLLGEGIETASDRSLDRVAELSTLLSLPFSRSTDVRKSVGSILAKDSRAINLRRLINQNPIQVEEAAKRIFGDVSPDQRLEGLSQLVVLLLRAKDPKSGAPLLTARYHLFLRSLEGAYVCYWPEKKILLSRMQGDEQETTFEVALCRECGQHYLVGMIKGGSLVEANRDPGHPSFGATFLRPIEQSEQGNESQGDRDQNGKQYRICTRCGKISPSNSESKCPDCSDNASILVEKQKEAQEKEDQVPRCSACGYRAQDPVREVVHGTDGPHAVIATSLYHNLPSNRKKVLAFADGRQEAAFFAWYLENSYKDILTRNSILRVGKIHGVVTPDGLSIRELATGLRGLFEERNFYPPSMGRLELDRETWLHVYREFLTDEQRISLEGVGLAQWGIKWPAWISIPDFLLDRPWSLSEKEAWNLLYVLLDSMRIDRAVSLKQEGGIPLTWNDLGLQASQMRIKVGTPGGARNVRSWDGPMGRRAQTLAKLLVSTGSLDQEAKEESVKALRGIWQALIDCEQSVPDHDRLLIPVQNGRMLNPDWWRFKIIPEDDTLFKCDVCNRIQHVSVGEMCVRYRCPGRLQRVELDELEPNHYRLLYEEDLPGALRVEEHTAQLENEKARKFQREFRQGNIHVLSCSTTFELGVDLGDLDTVFLRNVPPEAFNYIQRVGRAGRRSDHPGFAVTYCKRGPHDLYHFSNPLRMLGGSVKPPALALDNDKIVSRHVTAVALSAFFRAFPARFANTESFFANLKLPEAVTDVLVFLQTHMNDIQSMLCEIVPGNLQKVLGLNDGSWISRVTGEESRLAYAEALVKGDFETVTNLEQAAVERGDYDTAKWAKIRARTITGEDVLSLLSRKAVIPKYGFPVDVVELDTQHTTQDRGSRTVALNRDLSIAIAEFAPTGKLVANKQLWTSYGIKKVPEREWDRKWYARCTKHNRFERKPWDHATHSPPFSRCCPRMVISQYIEPKFGFVTNRDKPEDPKYRPARIFTTRPYFAGFKDRDRGEIPFNLVTLTTVSPGYMVVLCEGRRGEGFYICCKCGAGFQARKRKHKTPYGNDCTGRLEQTALGHEFVTHVLQLQFHPEAEGNMEPLWFAYSLAYALLEGAAEVLEIPSTDLNASVAYGDKYHVPPIILHDNVPGGAGLVARLEVKEILHKCFLSALKRVAECSGCGENSSCYSCLRSYRNQFAHQELQRGPVAYYLQKVLDEWK